MPLAPPQTVERTHVQDVVDQIRKDNYDFMQSAARRVEGNIKACWEDGQHTPQQFLNQLGDAAQSMELNRDQIAVILKYEQVIDELILDRSVLALVGEFTPNQDGTVTVL